MKINMKIVSFIVLVLQAETAFAAWTGIHNIKVLKAQSNGTYLVLDGFVNNNSSINCGVNTFFLLNTAGNYKERTSFLLAAYMSGKPVKVSYGRCSSGHIEIASVQLQ